MNFVGAVIVTIKCNNEFTGLFHNIDFGQKKNYFDQTEIFVY